VYGCRTAGAADRREEAVCTRGCGGATLTVGRGTKDCGLDTFTDAVEVLSPWMLRTAAGSFFFRTTVSTVEVRNAAPSGSLFVVVVVVAFCFSNGSGDDIVDGSSSDF